MLVLTFSTLVLARPGIAKPASQLRPPQSPLIRETREASPEPQRRRWNRGRPRYSNRRQGIPRIPTEVLALKAGVGLGLAKAGLLSGGIPAEKLALGAGLVKGLALASLLNNGK